MRTKSRTADELIARIASGQHGVITASQLLSAGVSPSSIKRRAAKGSLIRVYTGVYRVGHIAPSFKATYIAAVLACGDGALLGCRAAAFLLGVIRGPQPIPEVLTLTERRIPRVISHRTRHLDRRDRTRYERIPVTSVPRTLVDLAALLPAPELARAVHEAGVKYETKPRHVEAVLLRRPASPGASTLRAVIHGDTRVTLSALERRFLEVLEAEGLPLPQTNRVAGAHRVDCRWPGQQLTVELDSYRFHRSRHAWEQDRRRERAAHARGDQIRRYTWGDVFEQPRQMLWELTGLLNVEGPAKPGR